MKLHAKADSSQRLIQGGYRPILDKSLLGHDVKTPLVSVVTVVRNGIDTIERTLQSVIKFIGQDVEYVVIDGASTDGTVRVLSEYDERIAFWISEPDTGIYNAMNKGWTLSRGHYIYYLGADDTLLNLPINTLRDAANRGVDLVYGHVIFSDGYCFRSHYGPKLVFNCMLHHQGLFMRRSLWGDSPFDEQYKTSADFDLFQRTYKRRAIALQVQEIIALYDLGGISSRGGTIKEFLEVVHRNYGAGAIPAAFLLLKWRGLQYRLWRMKQNRA